MTSCKGIHVCIFWRLSCLEGFHFEGFHFILAAQLVQELRELAAQLVQELRELAAQLVEKLRELAAQLVQELRELAAQLVQELRELAAWTSWAANSLSSGQTGQPIL